MSARKYDASVKSIHNNKLAKLSPDFGVEPLKPDEVILNLSSYTLSNAEKNILVYGLNYTVLVLVTWFGSSDVSDLEFTSSLEIAARRIKSNLTDPASWAAVKR